LAEWLGIGLQNRVRRFESATDLKKTFIAKAMEVFLSCAASLPEWE
jgi:hypothetical protein